MKTKEIKIYKFSELSDTAKEKALNDWRNKTGEIFWQEETLASFQKCVEMAGLKLVNWEIGAYSPSFARIEDFQGADLTGPRAIAWLENNLLSRCRVPWKGPKRAEYRKYGNGYRPGQIKSCPFTGYCSDEDLLDSLKKDIRAGSTVKEAFEALADVCRKILETELDYQNSAEYFEEHADANGYEFTEDGERF